MGWPAVSYRFILLPSLVGLSCYACSQTPKTTANNPDANKALTASSHASGPMVSPTANQAVETSVSPRPEPSPTAEPVAKPQPAESVSYQAAISLASSAYQLSQSAISPDDWGLVASKWQRAIEQLERVDSNSDRHKTAQAKIAEYTRNAEHADSQVKALQASAKITVASQNLPTATGRSAPISEVRPPVPEPISAQSSNRVSPPVLTPPSLSPSQPVASKSSIPIVRRLHGTPVVRVTFDGLRTYDMILDTGASRTLITRTMANELEVVATERMIAATASESNVVFELGRVKSISMGEITLTNPQVSIGDSVSIGLLGNDFLRGYDMTIRGRENVVELTRS